MASDSKDGDDAMGGMGVEARPEDLDVLGAPEYETKTEHSNLGAFTSHHSCFRPLHTHPSTPQ